MACHSDLCVSVAKIPEDNLKGGTTHWLRVSEVHSVVTCLSVSAPSVRLNTMVAGASDRGHSPHHLIEDRRQDKGEFRRETEQDRVPRTHSVRLISST